MTYSGDPLEHWHTEYDPFGDMTPAELFKHLNAVDEWMQQWQDEMAQQGFEPIQFVDAMADILPEIKIPPHMNANLAELELEIPTDEDNPPDA